MVTLSDRGEVRQVEVSDGLQSELKRRGILNAQHDLDDHREVLEGSIQVFSNLDASDEGRSAGSG